MLVFAQLALAHVVSKSAGHDGHDHHDHRDDSDDAALGIWLIFVIMLFVLLPFSLCFPPAAPTNACTREDRTLGR